MQIEPMTDTHAGAMLAIYQAGIDEGNATFETGARREDLIPHLMRSRRGTAVKCTSWVAKASN
jgi:hypothetical protein